MTGSTPPTVSGPIVSNTTPLISLAEIGLLDVLRSLYGQIWVPQTVFAEYQAGLITHPLRPDLATLSWVSVRSAPVDPAVPLNLDLGETEAIVLARAKSAPLLLMDEQRGRAAAKRLGLPVSGSLGVLVEAKSQGFVPAVRPCLDQMVAQGRHVGARRYAQVLSLAGE